MEELGPNYDLISWGLMIGGIILLTIIIIIRKMADGDKKIKPDEEIDKKIKEKQKKDGFESGGKFY